MLLRQVATVWLFLIMSFTARAETLVVAAPFTEFPALASQILDGAKAAVTGSWTVKAVDAGCTAEAASGSADLILAERPDAVIGLPCIESLSQVLNTLGPIGIPIFTIGSRADAPSKLANKNSWHLYRTGPREREEITELARLIVEAWRAFPFAILNDGTIFARDTAEAIRNEAENAGLKPVLFEGFQPQLESQTQLIDKITASGATHVFIASDRANTAQIATQAENRGLTFAGSETLRASDLDFPLPAGVLMVTRDINLAPVATEKIKAIRQSQFEFAEGYAADAFVAAEMAMALKNDASARSFNTAMGQVKFGQDGFIEPVNFAFFRYDGFAFQKVLP